jgi:hypothetical protein
MQTAVIDLLTAGKLPGIDSRGVAEHLRSKFSKFVAVSMLHLLGDAPKHAPGVYVSIWRALLQPWEALQSIVVRRRESDKGAGT